MTDARRRRVAARAAALLGVLALGLASTLVAAPAAQATTYRYWTYWWGMPTASSWTFASLGPGSDRPKDRSVVGWRFATTTESGGRKAPRTSASWADHCSTPETAGKNRVAVVVDYGSSDDAPPGEKPPGSIRVECVLIDSGANGYSALSTADVAVRARGDGLVCGIDGYPRTECAAAVADPTPTPTRSSPKPTPKPTTTASAPPSRSASPTRTASSSSEPGPASTSAAAATGTTGAPAAASPSDEASSPAVEAEPTLPVTSGAPLAAATEAGGGPSAGFLLGALAVLAVGGAAWWTARGRPS